MRLVFFSPEGDLARATQSILSGYLSDVDLQVLPLSSNPAQVVERAEADMVIVALASDEITREVCRELRSDGRTAQLPLTGVLARSPQDLHAYGSLDMDVVLLRPVLPEDFVNSVRIMVSGRPKTGRSVQTTSSPAEAILESIPVAALAVAPDNIILKANRAFERLVGRNRSDMVGLTPWTRFIHTEDVSAHNKGTTGCPGRTTTRVCRIIRALGEVRTVQATTARLGVAGDRVISLVDITAHHETDALLRVSEARYRTTLESIHLGYFEVDLSGHLLFVNAPLCVALGISHDEIISRQVMDAVAPSSLRKLQVLFGRVLKDGKTERPVRIEMQIDQRPIVLELAVTTMTDATGAPVGFRGLARDVTHQVIREAEQRNIERLQGVVELAGAVCHELNQPLQSILGHSELLQMEIASDHPSKDRIGKIVGQVERMRGITAKLMGITQYRTRDHYKGARIIDLGFGPGALAESGAGDDPDEQDTTS